MSKVISLSQKRRQRKLSEMRGDEDRLTRLEGELDYRTQRLVEELDTLHGKVETLERTLLGLALILKATLPEPRAPEVPSASESQESSE